MATTKSTTKRNSKTGSTRGKQTGSSTKKTADKPDRKIARTIGAVVCLLLAVFAAFGYFEIHAVFIDFFVSLLKGLFGYGFWLAPPALLVAAWLLAFQREHPVALRLICVLLFPLVFGGIFQIILLPSFPAVSALWSTGRDMASGGLLSGLLTIGLSTLFSKVGAMIIFIVGLLLMVMAICEISFSTIAQAIRDRADREAEEEPPAETPVKKKKEPAQEKKEPAREPKKTPARRARADEIDIPLDDPPARTLEREEKKPFFRKETKVSSPDQTLTGQETETAGTAPETEKLKPGEAAQAAAEVSAEIQETMNQDTGNYKYPPLSLLTSGTGQQKGAAEELQANRDRLEDTMHSFGIDARISDVTRGPAVTRYEVELDQGVRLNKLTNLSDDIALALGASGVRIAPIPDKISMVGIEVPNKKVSLVCARDVIETPKFQNNKSKVAFALGKDIGGNAIVGNIDELPHLLIAGTTGSGKSVCTHSLIVSLLYKATPEEVRLIMVDPKMVELGVYNGIPHLLIPVVTDPKKAAGALQWTVAEMMKRYQAFSQAGVRDLKAYNEYASSQPDMEKMPQVVVVIDELADLMLVAAKEVEESICRVAQMGRAAGIHLVIATQRPSSDVITGLMKANIPSRIAFAVASALESRIILDTMGAEKLVGRGDMLYAPLGAGKPLRIQGCMITDQEVAAVVDFIKSNGDADYDDEIIHDIELRAAEKEKGAKGATGGAGAGSDDYDELLPSAVEVILDVGQASVSMLQRRLKLGYSRAARLVDQMEELGIVGPFEGSKARQILITKEDWQEMQFKRGLNDTAAEEEPVPEEFPYEEDAKEQDEPPF